MDTRLLRIFSAVARHGALPAASRQLHLTPSALSHGLKALETHLGVRLFDRVGGRLVLNQAGEQLSTQIEEPLAALEKAAGAIKALGQWGQGRLRIGAPGTICQHLIPSVARELHRAFPKLLVVLECSESAQLLQLLHENRIDLALSLEPEQAPGLQVEALFEDELLFAFSHEHPWADGRPLSPQDLRRQPLLTYSKSSFTAPLVQQFFRNQEIEPTALMEIGSNVTMRQLIKENVAVAILAPWVFDDELTQGLVKMRPLGSKPLKRRWVTVHRAERRLGLAEEECIKFCRRQLSSLRLNRKDLPEASLTPAR